MIYTYNGPIGSSINSFAAFLGGAALYFAPVSLSSIIANSVFIDKLYSRDKIDVFLEVYGSINLNDQQYQLLRNDVKETVDVLVDTRLANILVLSQDGEALYEMVGSKISTDEALGIAQAIDAGTGKAIIESEEGKRMALHLRVIPYNYKDFLLEAYKRGLVKPKEILEFL